MDSWALVSSALFCVYRLHPRPVGHPLSMNGNGEWTSAYGRCDKFGDGEWTSAYGRCDKFGDGEWTPAAAGVMDLARGRRNREVEIGKLRVEV